MIIIITNLITIGLLSTTIILIAIKTRSHIQKSLSQYQLIFSFLLLIIGTAADTLYHLGFGELFDTYGEYINLLFFPLIIFSIFTYSINRELEKRKKSELQLLRQNEVYLNTNQKLIESNNQIGEINAALTKTNKDLDSFVYRISHDLRAPICTSMGLTNLSFISKDINEIKYYLGLQETSLKRLDQFIKDILDYSINIHSEINPEIIDFNLLIDTAFQDYQIYNHGQIKLIKQLDSSIPFFNSLLQLRIIFNNLISNAIKFQIMGNPNQHITINIRTSFENAIIVISDNGIGIPNKFKNDVFKMFFRISNQNSGSGLGLYIVNDCIKKINGSIELISNVNEGTTIKIVVPNLKKKVTLKS